MDVESFSRKGNVFKRDIALDQEEFPYYATCDASTMVFILLVARQSHLSCCLIAFRHKILGGGGDL